MGDEPPHDRISTSIAGEVVELMAQRALFWPRRSVLFLSDLHLGKGDVFRRAGIALPSGGTEYDLDRLSSLLAVTEARSVCILGDVLHGAVSDSAWRATWAAWREQHAAVAMSALSGNHDRALPGAGLGIDLLGPVCDLGPFALRHEPAEVGGLHVLSGHLHPCTPMRGLGTRRWPVFWLRPHTTVLPAFSDFTGGCPVEVGRGDGLVVCAHGTAAWIRRPATERESARVTKQG